MENMFISLLTLIIVVSATDVGDEIETLSYKSIKAIHKHLDDDQDGDVNLEESNEFMVDELHVNDKRRHSSFHGNDSLISVEDLWYSWLQNEVHNWTTKQVVDWICNTVSLPQYGKNFSEKKIDGRMLPRFTNEGSSLYNKLGITNLKHRKKISLRATDIVLFGPPIKGYTKDVILAVVVTLMALACCYAIAEKKFAKKQIEQMMKDVEFMQMAEENLKNTQEKLKKAEHEHRSTVLSKAEIENKLKKEIETAKKEAERLHEERSHHEEERMKMSLVERELIEVRKALQKAEAEMETISPRSPRSLQQWLYITYRKESKHFIAKKNNALRQMQDAKEACEKIRKKRGSLFGPLRLVHGQTIDEVDQKILSARSALAEVTNDLQERQHRWRQIEELCCFPIVSDGLLNHSLEIEDQSRRSSVARALAVCANLGGIGSIPNSVPKSLSKMSSVDSSSNHSMPSKSRNDQELPNIYHGYADVTESFPSKSSPSRPVVAPLDKNEDEKEETNSDEGLNFLSSTINREDLHKNSLKLLPDTAGMEKTFNALKAINDNEGPAEQHGNISCLTNNRYSLKDFVMIEQPDEIKALHTSRSVPVFTSEKRSSDDNRQHLRHRSLCKVKAIQEQTSTSDGSSGSLSQLDVIQVDNDKCTKNRRSLASSEENLSQPTALDKCFGSNEELNSTKKKMSKKQKSRLASLVSKRPHSFDDALVQSESTMEQNKKKSILSKFRKK